MLKSGACGFIQKPYRVDELSATVRQALDTQTLAISGQPGKADGS